MPKPHARSEHAMTPTATVSVCSIRKRVLKKPVPVYDLSVSKYHNFALNSGVFVHNCKEIRLPWQEVLALKGKILNASRTDLAKILTSEEVMNIITATGARPGSDCKTAGGSVRVGKVIIMTDADSDGGHICSLLISLFSKYFRPWLDALLIGYIQLPLFVGAIGDKKEFGFTLDEMLNKWPEAKRNHVIVNRLKGLGEMTNTELLTYGMDPTTRRIQMLSFVDSDVAEVERVMGDDVAYRKEFLGIIPAPTKLPVRIKSKKDAKK